MKMKNGKHTITWTLVLTLLAAILLPAGVPALAEEEGLLRVAIGYDITTMDMSQTTDDYMIPMNVYDRLFETRRSPEGTVLVPSLCTDCQISEDGLTYTMTLREGIVFSNGNPLTASDVKFTFEHLLKANAMNTEIPEEVAGSEALMKGEADSLSGFQVQDDTHFTITLAAPNTGFRRELSSPAMSVLDEESFAQAKNFGLDTAETIGTGPYIVTEWIVNDHYTLERNPRYWGPEPSVKKVIVSVIKEPSTQDTMFQAGQLDLIDLKNLDSLVVERIYKTTYADRIVNVSAVGLTMLALNENNQYLKDVRVRKAVGMALNVDQIIAGIFAGDATPEHGIIPNGVQGHNEDLQSFTYDPDAAKALLKEAGYAEGQVAFELALDSSADTNTQNLYNAVREQLQAVGIAAEIQSYDHSSWLAKRRAGEMDSFIGTWGMDYNDPANIMYPFFGSPDKTRERSLNYPDTEIMARVAAAPSIVDEAKWIEEYQALEKKIVAEDAAWIPLLEKRHLYCMGERVASFTPQWAGFTDFYVSDVVMK